MRMRIGVLAASLALFSLGSVGGAQAAIQTFTVDSKALLTFQGFVIVTGTIRCDSGDTFRVAAQLSQRKAGQTAGGNSPEFQGTCTGLTQTWSLGVAPSQGEFRQGSATAFILALDATDGDLRTLTTTIHIHK
jgi:hypothetical protein